MQGGDVHMLRKVRSAAHGGVQILCNARSAAHGGILFLRRLQSAAHGDVPSTQKGQQHTDYTNKKVVIEFGWDPYNAVRDSMMWNACDAVCNMPL